jgi:hypothetical protein
LADGKIRRGELLGQLQDVKKIVCNYVKRVNMPNSEAILQYLTANKDASVLMCPVRAQCPKR